MQQEMPSCMAAQDHEQLKWPQKAIALVNDLNAFIPPAWLVPKALLDKFPLGCDIRPLARESGILSARELEITDFTNDATALLQDIATQKYSAAEVLTAYAKRAALAQQAVTCLAGFTYREALQRAIELDDHLQRTGETVGPLHGLPISTKSQYHIKGRVCSAGFTNAIVAHDTAHSIEILQDAGAIVFCQTNLPQAIMHLETWSFWGLTRNPLNTNLSPGGSSGGCSALMAFGGSPFSMGSDIGGSVRHPASATGLWTLKPTALRVPRARMFGLNPGADSINASHAPQCRSLRDINLFFTVIFESKPWLNEHSLVPLPWRIDEKPGWKGKNGKIRIGIMENDGVVRPQPPICRGLKHIEGILLQNPDIEVVRFQPFKHDIAEDLDIELYFCDEAARVKQVIKESQEPMLPLTDYILNHRAVKNHNMHELWALNARRESFRAEYLDYWNKQNVDLIICPVAPQTAPQLNTSTYWNYTSIWNLLDYAAATFPTGLTVNPTLDMQYEQPYDALSETDKYVQSIYDPAIYKNTPICLQAVAGRFEDEKLVHAFRIIEESLRNKN